MQHVKNLQSQEVEALVLTKFKTDNMFTDDEEVLSGGDGDDDGGVLSGGDADIDTDIDDLTEQELSEIKKRRAKQDRKTHQRAEIEAQQRQLRMLKGDDVEEEPGLAVDALSPQQIKQRKEEMSTAYVEMLKANSSRSRSSKTDVFVFDHHQNGALETGGNIEHIEEQDHSQQSGAQMKVDSNHSSKGGVLKLQTIIDDTKFNGKSLKIQQCMNPLNKYKTERFSDDESGLSPIEVTPIPEEDSDDDIPAEELAKIAEEKLKRKMIEEIDAQKIDGCGDGVTAQSALFRMEDAGNWNEQQVRRQKQDMEEQLAHLYSSPKSMKGSRTGPNTDDNE